MLKIGIIFTIFYAAACGGPGSFEGSVNGFELDVKSAMVAKIENDAIMIVLSDHPNICAELKLDDSPASVTLLVIGLTRRDAHGNSLSVQPGVYDVNIEKDPRLLAVATFDKSDGLGNSLFRFDESTGTSEGTAVAGTVTLDSISATDPTEGTFSLSFGTMKWQASGSFSAAYCDIKI